MVKKFEQQPYVFRPPRYRAWLAPLFRALNRHFYLAKRFRTSDLQVLGDSAVREAYRRETPILIAANHADHCDPHVMFEVAARLRIPFYYMAAREAFEARGGKIGWVMQRAGCFSVNREGMDRKAILTAIEILASARAPLVIFPEGEIYHTSERLAPLNEGVATILLRAAAKRAQAENKDAILVPTTIRYRYVDDVAASIGPCLDELESSISWKPQSGLPIVERIYKFGEALLAVKEREWLGEALDGTLVERLDAFRLRLLEPLEARYGLPGDSGSVPQRVKLVRNKIRGTMFADDTPPDQIAGYRSDLDRLFVVVQLYSYPGQYLRERPTTERVAETIIKLQEDVFGRSRVPGRRAVTVTFAEPINVAGLLDAYEHDSKRVVTELTERLEMTIGAQLEAHTK